MQGSLRYSGFPARIIANHLIEYLQFNIRFISYYHFLQYFMAFTFSTHSVLNTTPTPQRWVILCIRQSKIYVTVLHVCLTPKSIVTKTRNDLQWSPVQWSTMSYTVQWELYNDLQWSTNDLTCTVVHVQWSTMTYNELQWPTISCNELQWSTYM